MTSHQYQFSIYEPLEVTIALTNKETGQRLEQTVQFSVDEDTQYRALKTKEERDQFEAALATKYARQLIRSANKAPDDGRNNE